MTAKAIRNASLAGRGDNAPTACVVVLVIVGLFSENAPSQPEIRRA
jgi:hypothetical protein